MGVVMTAIVLTRVKDHLTQRGRPLRHPVIFAASMVGAVGLLLGALHGAEAIIWAAAYVALGAIDTWGHAILYSLDSMTTRGASKVFMHEEWELLGALEAADGMLLFGVSTAFVFAMIEGILPIFIRTGGRRRRGRP
jgi:hypothetical protein